MFIIIRTMSIQFSSLVHSNDRHYVNTTKHLQIDTDSEGELTGELQMMSTLDWALPHFIFISPSPATGTTHIREGSLVKAWTRAINTLPSTLQSHFTVLEGTLSGLPPERLGCDCVVSPANAFGIMEGG